MSALAPAHSVCVVQLKLQSRSRRWQPIRRGWQVLIRVVRVRGCLHGRSVQVWTRGLHNHSYSALGCSALTSSSRDATNRQEPCKMASTARVAASSAPQTDSKNVDAAADDAASAGARPPPEPSESIWLRRSVIFSFWLVVILLGLPVWWKTTAIYRAELPLQAMTEWADGKVRGPGVPLS